MNYKAVLHFQGCVSPTIGWYLNRLWISYIRKKKKWKNDRQRNKDYINNWAYREKRESNRKIKIY